MSDILKKLEDKLKWMMDGQDEMDLEAIALKETIDHVKTLELENDKLSEAIQWAGNSKPNLDKEVEELKRKVGSLNSTLVWSATKIDSTFGSIIENHYTITDENMKILTEVRDACFKTGHNIKDI